MTARSPNPFEQHGREIKAARLVVEIDDYFAPLGQLPKVVIETVERWTDQDWEGIAGLARVNKPSPDTRALVISLLKARARRAS
jgi:hypothetical protein